MASKEQSYPVRCQGGLITNMDDMSLAQQAPGASLSLVNFEPALDGGYRRISGYAKQNSGAIPGQGKVLGVHVYFGGVVAVRETPGGGSSQVYYSNGVSWTPVGTPRNSVQKFFFHDYYLPDNRLLICDGVNRPAKWDRYTYTELTDAPIGAEVGIEHKKHLFLAKGSILTISQPNDDEGYDAALGAGQINLGDDIVNLHSYQGQLIIFCQNSIYRLEGNNTFDFVLNTVSQNIGLVSRDTVFEIGGELLFLAPDGIRPLSVTDTVGAFQVGTVTKQVQSVIDALVKEYAAKDMSVVVLREKTQFRFLFGADNVVRASTKGILGQLVDSGQGTAWEWAELKGIKASCAHSAYAGTREIAVFGGFDGYVYQLERGSDFDGQGITEEFKTPNHFFQDVATRVTPVKVHTYLTLEGNVNLNLNLAYDRGVDEHRQPATTEVFNKTSYTTFGNAQFGVDKFTGINKTTVITRVQGSGNAVSLTYSTQPNSSAYTIHSYVIEFLLRGHQ